ncbi:MAG: tRNA (adenosine(37)-N6)-dimethylallyltransferase MiaA [Candidatus Margulisiibacteriota bacterium]
MQTIILLGPTAVGKSKAAVELALQINGEIISADSMQVYRGMDIGTAKPTKEEQKGIPHHLIDIRNPEESWTVSDFVEQSNHLTIQLSSKGKTPIIVGGTGLYLWTLINGYNFAGIKSDEAIRKRLEELPPSTLYAQLSTVDPLSAQKIHPHNKKRVMRALEVFELTGEPISKQQEKLANGKQLTATIIGLTLPRNQLYEHIEQRIENMIKAGLIDEVKGLLDKGYSKGLTSMQALGYKEVVEFLEGRWDREKLIYELKKRTRHFARRQMTWFRRFRNVQWIDATPENLNNLAKFARIEEW